jgi:hypothetical protein
MVDHDVAGRYRADDWRHGTGPMLVITVGVEVESRLNTYQAASAR